MARFRYAGESFEISRFWALPAGYEPVPLPGADHARSLLSWLCRDALVLQDLRAFLTREFSDTTLVRQTDEQVISRLAVELAHGRIVLCRKDDPWGVSTGSTPGPQPRPRPTPGPQPPKKPGSVPPLAKPKLPPVKEKKKLLVLTKVDDHFAPSVEKLDLTYNILGLSGERVQLIIEAKNGGGKIFERDLTGSEKSDGDGKTLAWDGKINAGSRKDRHATPLMAPFKARIVAASGLEGEKPFKILYHSIKLDWGKHTPDGATPPVGQKEKYAQARLNELGYDGGPVTGTLGTITQKALRRFQRANYQVGTTTQLAENGTLDAPTLAALQSASAVRRWEQGKKPLTQDSRLYVHDNYFNDRGADFVTTTVPEFNSMNRKTHVEDKLERPYVALEAQVLLLNKANTGVVAQDAVGKVPLAWEAHDDTEDASVIPSASNALARTYVQRARQVGTSASASGARIDVSGDNAPKSLDGFRETSAADYVKVWFPNSADSKLAPYAVRAYDSVSRGGKTFHRALVDAWDDDAQHPRCKGRAGVYFRHSTKGGDDAKVRVALTFKGLPNEADLETLHKARENDLFVETGRWTVWRRGRVSAYCQQAAPTRPSGSPTWATIRDWWSQAFYEMENNGNPLQTINYTTVVTSAVYTSTILAMPASHRPAGVTSAAHLTYRPGCIYGGPAIAQNPAEAAADYITRAQTAMRSWIRHPLNAILGVIHGQARKTSPEGLIIFDFRIHNPITGQDWDPALNAGAGGFKASTNPSVQNQVASTAGYVRLDGAVTMNVDNGFNVNCYVLHECGHARFLYHHKTGGGGAANASDNPTHHDADQEKCTMSYGITPFTANTWTYPFCGKCILRLRGWKVTGLPQKYTA